ncbi:FadR/GntR family transcriptional regulator [Streptomyces rishiriensis]|uniref:FadR/GntR family transcriptional regulator n=1 Tax=Streptomyces rishiriensis TaxID=68264 RepID=UPI000D59D29F|nr:GntR family transcriptional regulator [Streptomyces rishiriensis]
MVNAAGKFGPYTGWDTRVLAGRGPTGAELVRSRIALRVRLGSVAPGDRLPDAGVLAEELGISEITVRRALEAMCQDGLLDRRRGRAGGTFVATDWDAVVAVMYDAEEAAALDAFHLLLECGLVAHAAGELTGELPGELPGGPLDGPLDGLRALVQEMDLTDDPAQLLELETRFHLDLAQALGGAGIREFAADLLGRQCLLGPAPAPAHVRARNRCHADLLDELARGAMDPAVRAVKAHRHAGPR